MQPKCLTTAVSDSLSAMKALKLYVEKGFYPRVKDFTDPVGTMETRMGDLTTNRPLKHNVSLRSEFESKYSEH